MSVKENEKNVTSINMLKPIFLLLLSFCKVMTFMGQIFIHNSLYCYKEFETNSFNTVMKIILTQLFPHLNQNKTSLIIEY